MFTPVEIISWQTFKSPLRQASQKTLKSSLKSSGFSSLSWPDEMAWASVARAASISYFFLTSMAVAKSGFTRWPRHIARVTTDCYAMTSGGVDRRAIDKAGDRGASHLATAKRGRCWVDGR